MSLKNKPQEKSRLHPRNRNRERYDLEALMQSNPALKRFVLPNKHGDLSVDFANPSAVKVLNKALLHHYYGIKNWDFPDENLCPPIPGRADYIHQVADLIRESNFGRNPDGNKITCLDVGVGASCIYPILGVIEYNWSFIASDIDPKSLTSAQQIIDANAPLKGKIECRLQNKPNDVFYGILSKSEKFDISICNPPFHSSKEEALKGSKRKVRNLTGKSTNSPKLNFSGISNELIYEGGESQFIYNMIRQSKRFYKNCYWFTTLVSKQSNLNSIYKTLDKFEANQVKTISMGTGNKSSRIVAWSFLNLTEQNAWKKSRW